MRSILDGQPARRRWLPENAQFRMSLDSVRRSPLIHNGRTTLASTRLRQIDPPHGCRLRRAARLFLTAEARPHVDNPGNGIRLIARARRYSTLNIDAARQR